MIEISKFDKKKSEENFTYANHPAKINQFYRFLLNFANIGINYIKAFTDFYQFINMLTDLYQLMNMFVDLYQFMNMFTDLYHFMKTFLLIFIENSPKIYNGKP